MGSAVEVKITEDSELIRGTVLSVWDEVSEDGASKESWYPNFYRRTYLAAYVDGAPVAVLSAHPITSKAVQVHIHVPKEQRQHKYDAGKALIDFMGKEGGFVTIVAMIPVIFPNVSGFAKKLGFKYAGMIKRAHLKDGDLHDVTVLQLELGESDG